MTFYSDSKEELDKPGSIYQPAEYLGGVGRLSTKEKKTKVPQIPKKESELGKKILEFGL